MMIDQIFGKKASARKPTVVTFDKITFGIEEKAPIAVSIRDTEVAIVLNDRLRTFSRQSCRSGFGIPLGNSH